MKQTDSFQRAYDLGREVSITHAAPGSLKRLSVAVLLRDPDSGKRTPVEINQITQLVRSAVGFDQSRNDNVTVISRKFASGGELDGKRPWYDNSWLPMVARNATALVIALLVLTIGVRPLVKGMTGKRDKEAAGAATGPDGLPIGGAGEAGESQVAVAPPVTLDQIETASTLDDRIGMVRGFTRDNPARAALAIRDMIKADAK